MIEAFMFMANSVSVLGPHANALTRERERVTPHNPSKIPLPNTTKIGYFRARTRSKRERDC
jgi:hypothetical protein